MNQAESCFPRAMRVTWQTFSSNTRLMLRRKLPVSSLEADHTGGKFALVSLRLYPHMKEGSHDLHWRKDAMRGNDVRSARLLRDFTGFPFVEGAHTSRS